MRIGIGSNSRDGCKSRNERNLNGIGTANGGK